MRRRTTTDDTGHPDAGVPRRTALLTAVGATLLGAGVAILIAWAPWQTSYGDIEPGEPPLSAEAAQGCLMLGMDAEQIVDDQAACLREYWTYERLLRSSGIDYDWLRENGIEPCGSDGICDLIGYPELADYPPEDDPWWDEQATSRPDRTTVGGQNLMEQERDW